MSLTDELRATMRDNAANAPEGATLMQDVRRRSGQMKRRRLMVISAVLVAVASVGGYTIFHDRQAPLPAAAGPSIPDSSLIAAGDLSAGLPAFPYTPGWIPPGAGQFRAGLEGSFLTLDADHATLTVKYGSVLPWTPLTYTAKDTPDTVGGKPATSRVGSELGNRRQSELVWQPDENKWISIVANGIELADLKRFAENLRPAPIAITLPMRLALVPKGHVVTSVTAIEICFNSASSDSAMANREVCVTKLGHQPGETYTPSEPQDITINGHKAVLGSGPETSRVIVVNISDDLQLAVKARRSSITSDADLRKFAEGVTLPE